MPGSSSSGATGATIVVYCAEAHASQLQPALDVLTARNCSVQVQSKVDSVSIGLAVRQAGLRAIYAICPSDSLDEKSVRSLRLLIGARGVQPDHILTIESDWRNPMALIEAIDSRLLPSGPSSSTHPANGQPQPASPVAASPSMPARPPSRRPTQFGQVPAGRAHLPAPSRSNPMTPGNTMPPRAPSSRPAPPRPPGGTKKLPPGLPSAADPVPMARARTQMAMSPPVPQPEPDALMSPPPSATDVTPPSARNPEGAFLGNEGTLMAMEAPALDRPLPSGPMEFAQPAPALALADDPMQDDGADLYAEILDDAEDLSPLPQESPVEDSPSHNAFDSATATMPRGSVMEGMQRAVTTMSRKVRRWIDRTGVTQSRPRLLALAAGPVVAFILVAGALALSRSSESNQGALEGKDSHPVTEPAAAANPKGPSDPKGTAKAASPAEAAQTDPASAGPDEEALPVALKKGDVAKHGNLIYAPTKPQKMSFHEGESLCRGLKAAKSSGWRLGTIGELNVLTDESRLPKGVYWSSTDANSFGPRALVWSNKKTRASPIARGWKGAYVLCVLER